MLSRPDQSETSTAKSLPLGLSYYLAGALGAFVAGFGDLLSNDKASAVVKIYEVLRVHFLTQLDNASVALLLITLLGAAICWVYQPINRVDAFVKGLGIFALVNIATPYEIPPGKSFSSQTANQRGHSIFIVGTALAQITPHKQDIPSMTISKPTTIIIKNINPNQPSPDVTMTVRDVNTKRILTLDRTIGHSVTLRKPPGKYLLEVEVPGYRRASAVINTHDHPEKYFIELTETKIPLSIQRLIPPAYTELNEVPEARHTD